MPTNRTRLLSNKPAVLAAASAAAVTLSLAGGAYASKVKVADATGDPAPPSATQFDLTGTNTLGSLTINGAVFERTDVQPTGTGVIDPFVRLQSPGSSATEDGHNTDSRKLENEENNSPNFTRSIQLDNLGTVNLGGLDYYQFLLDINEPNGASKEFLSLDELEIYQSDDAALNGYSASTKFGSGASLVYDLDSGLDRYIKLDANINSGGSGSGDMYAYIPTSLFGQNGDYLYFYSRFGDHFSADGGFEEWAGLTGGPSTVVEPPPDQPPVVAIPLPPAAWSGLAMMGLMAGGIYRKRLRAVFTAS